jgi:hypothetical protein
MLECMNSSPIGFHLFFIPSSLSDTRPYALSDSHGVSGETLFGRRLKIDMSMPWGFVAQLWKNIGSSNP